MKFKEKHNPTNINCSSLIRHWCDINFKDWDNGYYEAAIIGEDSRYVFFYQTDKEKHLRFGFLIKEYIEDVTMVHMSERKRNKFPDIPNEHFIGGQDPFRFLKGKVCDIQLHSPKLSTFLLSSDGYEEATIISTNQDTIIVRDGKDRIAVRKADIVGIVESSGAIVPSRDDENPGNITVANPDTVYPVPGIDTVTYVKPTITNPNIIVGDFTYFNDVSFETHVKHHFDFYGDKLIIGKFCQIAANVDFIMNGANHQMNAVSTFPFYIFEGWEQEVPKLSDFPVKGDTTVGNDVWIGENATILPGVTLGDGAIIAANSVVGNDVGPYTIAGGNPAKVIRKRFDEELIGILEELKWWNLPIDEINKIIPILCNSNLEEVKGVLKGRL